MNARGGTRLRYAAFIGAVIGAYVTITALIAMGGLLEYDLEARGWIDHEVPSEIKQSARIVTFIGQGGPLSAITMAFALYLVVRYKSAKPFLQWLATFILLMAVVGVPKVALRRGAPRDPLVTAVEFFSKELCGGPACQSYPSGHAANAVVWYGLAMIFLNGQISRRLQWVLLVLLSFLASTATVIAGYHWVTDTISGLLAGLAVIGTVEYFSKFAKLRIPELEEIVFGMLLRSKRRLVSIVGSKKE